MISATPAGREARDGDKEAPQEGLHEERIDSPGSFNGLGSRGKCPELIVGRLLLEHGV